MSISVVPERFVSIQKESTAGKRLGVPYLFELIGMLVAILLWGAVTADNSSIWAEFQIPKVLSSLFVLVGEGTFWLGVGTSLERLFVGVGLAILVGVPVGILVGYSSLAHRLTYVPFQFLRVISPLAWTPIAIMAFGIGSAPARFLIAIAAVWPVIMSTAHGVRTIDGNWIQMVQSFGGSSAQVLRHVVIRGAMPSALTGIQLAVGIGWIILVPAEMLGVSSGIGYMILDARDVNDYSTVMALILATGCVGLLIDLPIRWISKAVSW